MRRNRIDLAEPASHSNTQGGGVKVAPMPAMPGWKASPNGNFQLQLYPGPLADAAAHQVD
jgi:hypothetical protein